MIPFINLSFNEPDITMVDIVDYMGREVKSNTLRLLWDNRIKGDNCQSEANERLFGKPANFGQSYVYTDKVCPTLLTKECSLIHFDRPLLLSKSEVCSISTFPQDYDFGNQKPHYACGMSVPPVMIAQIATRIYEQWLSKINL